MLKKNSFTLEEAQKRLEHYCAYQERCHYEVEQKLRELNMISSVQEIIITKLLGENYLNETRFSQSFARGKFRIKKWGRKRIIRELKAKRISDYNIKKGLREISDEDYNETFYTLFEKRKASVDHYPLYERKRKILDYMVYRGWEKEKIYASLNDLKT